MSDATRIMRQAQLLVVEYQTYTGAPPAYSGTWLVHPSARVEQLSVRGGKVSSQAAFSLPLARWSDNPGFKFGDKIRIVRNDIDPALRTCVFSGFVVGSRRGYFGGDAKGKSWESLVVQAMDYRWLLGACVPITGQFGRCPDDYIDLGEPDEAVWPGKYSEFTGRDCVFNQEGLPNRDPVDVTIDLIDYPLFSGRPNATYWTARQIIRYLLGVPVIGSVVSGYAGIGDPKDLPGLNHGDWDAVLPDVSVKGFDIPSTIDRVANMIGWSWREDYDLAGAPQYKLFKVGTATGAVRASGSEIVLHELYAPPVGESVVTGVAAGAKLLWQCDLSENIAAVINSPVAQGALERYEVTVELVKGWKDSDFNPERDVSESGGWDYSRLFAYDSDLADYDNPNDLNYYRYHHVKGSDFKRDVLRKWVMNESGIYTGGDYNRGAPFDLATIIDPSLIIANNKRRYGLYRRALLKPISYQSQQNEPNPIFTEISYDGGTTWEPLKCGIKILDGEAGIYLTDASLADIREVSDDTRYIGNTKVELNYYSALAFDSFFNHNKIKVRVTACIEVDQRITKSSTRTSDSASPFFQRRLFSFGDRFRYAQKTESSQYDSNALTYDHTAQLTGQVDAIRQANQDASVSGVFTLDRLWIGDETGLPTFAIGDGISKIAGRNVSLALAGAESGYPDIIQINYLPATQRTEIVTRDTRYARNMVL